MLTGFLNLIILMGAVQGFIISGLLYFSRKNQAANQLLAVFIFLIALACLNLFIHSQQWASSGSVLPLVLAVVPMVVVMPLGPLLFLYTKASLDPGFVLTKKDRLRFLPVLIDLVPQITALFFIVAILTRALKSPGFDLGLFIDHYNVYSDIPRWVSLTVYLVFSMRYLAAFKRTTGAAAAEAAVKWIRQLNFAFVVFQSIWLVYLIPYIIPAYGDRLLAMVNWYPIYVPMSILIYWLGIRGYLVMQQQPPATKKRATVLPDAASAQILATLQRAMEQDKLYLDPALNLGRLAHHTAVPVKTISTVLNQYGKQGFAGFVNGYRVEAFKARICSDEVLHLTIAGIAAECGFNSQATFQRIFRQFTGLSPREFKIQAEKKHELCSNPDLSVVKEM